MNARSQLKSAAAKRLADAQRAFHVEQRARQALIVDRLNALASHERFAKRDARRAAEREKQIRQWERESARHSKLTDTLVGYFPMAVILGDETDSMTGAELYVLYLEWCAAEGISHPARLGQNTFYSALETVGAPVGITRKRTRRGIEFVGVRPAADA